MQRGRGINHRYGPVPLVHRNVPPARHQRVRSTGRLRPAPVDKASTDDLPTTDAMLDALRVPAGINPTITYQGTAPLTRRRVEDEVVVNHRTLLQAGLKCQQDWKLDSPALTNMTALAAALIVRPLTSKDNGSLITPEHVEASCRELQKTVVDQYLTISRDLDALVAMATAIKRHEVQLEEQGDALGQLRQQIRVKRERHGELEACNNEALKIMHQQPLPVLDLKCQEEEAKIRRYTDELLQQRAVHEARIRDFQDINANLNSLLQSLRGTVVDQSEPQQDMV
eukprot:Protomagalhaensia_wolfi_Nauph_80__82@NODE_1049_length_1772_cov_470_686671_g793_i0_p1_GENE_NODE_1049_length_1772_cov_470_686671_g793_i0NODE_1049_length_1772_cov_470_686671_g793_i0_p1_ORF_typecomplete_len283_score35_22AIP3/PF03915_13/0_17DHR10/PF18595_1/0_054DHR10/PF18595_1/3_2e02Vir_act_alpha_C/PF10400_9/41Vir_act_alpha_C/PF10400_9/8_7Med9/PF07544_13/6Med9/PF07544_13/22Med9/PF07544_13/1_1e03MbeD_MobD/PF04899_12/0_34MbeD_MobD/PF04899_12/1_1e03MbeD_MobD/PF04899_12/1_4e03_NODE_1049_length_1772_cov_4